MMGRVVSGWYFIWYGEWVGMCCVICAIVSGMVNGCLVRFGALWCLVRWMVNGVSWCGSEGLLWHSVLYGGMVSGMADGGLVSGIVDGGTDGGRWRWYKCDGAW